MSASAKKKPQVQGKPKRSGSPGSIISGRGGSGSVRRGVTPTYPGGPARGRATPAAVPAKPAKPLSKPVLIGGPAKKKKPKPATQIPGFAYGRKTY